MPAHPGSARTRTLLLAAFLGLPLAASADLTGVWVDAVTNTSAVRLGQPFHFVLTAGIRDGTVQLPGAGISWSGCRQLAYHEADVSQRHEGYTARQGRYTLTAFALDELQIPPLAVKVTYYDQTTATVESRAVTVKIISERPGKGMELIDPRPPRRAYWLAPELLALLGFLVLAGGAWAWRFRKKRSREQKHPPHREALLRLDALRKRRVLDAAGAAGIAAEASGVLRAYLAQRFAVKAMELARAELVAALRAHLPREDWQTLYNLLLQADLVKYAKAAVTAEASRQMLEQTARLVTLTQPKLEPKRKKERPSRLPKGRRV